MGYLLFFITCVVAFILIGKYKKQIKKMETEASEIKTQNSALEQQSVKLNNKLEELGATEYYEVLQKTQTLQREFDQRREQEEKSLQTHLQDLSDAIELQQSKKQEYTKELFDLKKETERLSKQIKTQKNKLSKSKELVSAVNYSLENYFNYEPSQRSIRLSDDQLADIEEYSPSVILKLHSLDVKDLRKAFRENNKQISSLMEQYASRYTTKANQAIYKLMVIALRAELQNVLYNLKYQKLDESIDNIKEITQKYLSIAAKGNQSIAGNLTKFIGEIEYLFINAVKIEYNYYVRREQAKQEQMAIREQMRQEAAERKALEAERKKIAREEEKFHNEISKLDEQLATAADNEKDALRARILELQAQLSDVVVKKEQISNLANGKAGNVYIISNLGSFGEDVFKIGMTRRLEPQDRINELGSASVPFKFDVHSFIFSDDAVALEGKLHNILNDRRVNKVNLRKEFFKISIDELENLVNEIEPTAEFNKTMLAEEYRQSISGEVYNTYYDSEENDDEEIA